METFSTLLALCAGNSPVTGEFPSKRPVTWSLTFSLICTWINGSVNNREAGDLRPYRAHYVVIVMYMIDQLTSDHQISIGKLTAPFFEEAWWVWIYISGTGNFIWNLKLKSQSKMKLCCSGNHFVHVNEWKPVKNTQFFYPPNSTDFKTVA